MLSNGKINKKELFLKSLETHDVTIFVVNHPDLRVPMVLGDTQGIVLNYGLNYPIPIPDLKIDDDGISATLSFKRTPHKTFVPWAAVAQISIIDSFNVTFVEAFEHVKKPTPQDESLVDFPSPPKSAKPTLTIIP